MFELRTIGLDAIPSALSRAERYRLLNEPREAESICRDILAADPGNHDATVCLILALTDLFPGGEVRAEEVRPLLHRLATDFERQYYTGVLEERWAKALLASGYSHDAVFRVLREAMRNFEAAEAISPPGNDDAVLRWNACVRMIERHGLSDAEDAEESNGAFDDDVPVR
jgi:hypothetical protein